ncbi:hypothetical protein ACLRGI_05175 [Paenarthrobacter nitroguajacolicus]|uniref:hypothetical protein n=1 Tax=Paenarthrobacter nitroguajacolicus TaxID=211146 RepID=UPI003ADD69A7
MGKLPEGMTNERYLRFGPEALVEGGPTMKDGLSIEQQIEKAPVDALWNKQMQWNGYRTSVYDQLAFNAKGIAQGNAELAALRSLVTQLIGLVTQGVPVVIDYDRIAQDIRDSMPSFEITPITKED